MMRHNKRWRWWMRNYRLTIASAIKIPHSFMMKHLCMTLFSEKLPWRLWPSWKQFGPYLAKFRSANNFLGTWGKPAQHKFLYVRGYERIHARRIRNIKNRCSLFPISVIFRHFSKQSRSLIDAESCLSGQVCRIAPPRLCTSVERK